MKTRTALSVALSALMVFSMIPTGAIKAIADEAIPQAEVFEASESIEEEEAFEQHSEESPETPVPETAESMPPASQEVDEPQTDETLQVDEEPQADEEPLVLTYEDDALIVTAEAEPGVLPEGASLQVSEVRPVDQESADAYGEALASLSDELRDQDKDHVGVAVYDIAILTADGTEIEPNNAVHVSLQYKNSLDLSSPDASVESVDVAHLTAEGELEMMDAAIDATEGAVDSLEFTTESFSYYIVFGSRQGSDTEPVNIGEYGWLKFATTGKQDTTPGQNDPNANWGHYTQDWQLPRTNSEEGYRRILQVQLHILQPGHDETDYENGYVNAASNEYFWTWDNSIYISDFHVPGYEVVETKMHTAWDDLSLDKWQDSLVGNYEVRGYRSSDGTSSQLNVLDVYMKSVPTPQNAMRYIVRYVHADGSVTDGNVRYLSPGQSVTLDVDKPRTGEKFSGIAVAAGAEAVTSNVDAKTVTFTFDENVNLAKAYIYFEDDSVDNTSQTKGRYDKENNKYYNGEIGLYTDKSAESVAGEGREREFLVNLEAWYVDRAASVGMILDASGSMVWTAGVPTELDLDSILKELPPGQQKKVLSHDNERNTIPLNDLTKLGILDTSEVDNSNLGYNSYKYYVYTTTAAPTNPTNEYAPLGYARGDTNNSLNRSPFRLGVGNTTEGYADRQNDGGQAGWYYVNPSTTKESVNQYGSKRFEGVTNNGQGGTGPATFWVRTNSDGSHTLMCKFDCGSKDTSAGPRTQYSPVYVKRDQMMTKSETLQDSIAQFAAILNGVSPQSEVAISRFSHSDFTNLNMLNWTKNSEAIIAAMDLVKGSPTATGSSTKADGTYQYVITGGTLSRFGFENFSSVHKAHADSGDNQKYIVLFTDGKDQGPSRGYPIDKNWLNNNGYQDYTIITMFMRSVGMSNQDVADSRAFLQGLASGGKGGNPNEKLFFEATSDDAHAVVDQFREIAEHIVTGLSNYSVRDYIDPRFDVVNEAGQVLTVLDANGEFKNATNPDVDPVTGMRGFTTPDGKHAQLGYDPERKMFYVIWQHQDIQASPVGGSSVTPWKSQIRVVAKEDFLGGNDILTNGNEPGENLVYKPQTDKNGNTCYDNYGRELVDDSAEHKSFPFAAVNPGLLDVALGNYEDTIFLGEEITPGDLLSTLTATTPTSPAKERSDAQHRVMDTVYNADLMTKLGDTDQSSIWYVEYLERLGKKRHNDIDYYYTLLRHVKLTGNGGVDRIITALKGDNNYIVTENEGRVIVEGKANTPAAGEKITIIKTGDNAAKVELELPYYYLDSPTDPTQTAGRDRANVMDPQDDQVGTITYTWKLVDLANNQPNKDTKDEANDFVTFDTYVNQSTHMDTTRPVQYQFSMRYEALRLTPDAKSDGSLRPSEGDGSERTRALTGLTNRETALIRNVDSSNERTEPEATTDKMGWAVIHIVDGRILIEKKMLTRDWEVIQALGLKGTMTFTLTGDDITSEPADEVVWTLTVNLANATAVKDGEYTYITLGTDARHNGHWVENLPMGDYTLTEEVNGCLKKVSIDAGEAVFDTDAVTDPAGPYDGTVTNWRAKDTDSIVFHIGQVNGGVPSSTSYVDTDYTYGVVKSDLDGKTPKNVDPLLSVNNGKAYLNAQLGHVEVKNTLIPTSIEVTKTWKGHTPSTPIVVKVSVKTGADDNAPYYVELNATNGWSATVKDVPLGNTTYTAEEGTGTVKADGTCADFKSFGGVGEAFKFENVQYTHTETAYTDNVPEDVTPAPQPATDVTANVAPVAGSIAFKNGVVTKVTVVKVWHGMEPAEGEHIVIKLVSSDPSKAPDRYVELSAKNDWEYTFENLETVDGLTYTAIEGSGTVTADGSCTDFVPFATDENGFKVGSRSYQQVSVVYTNAKGKEVENLDGSALSAPDAGTVTITNTCIYNLPAAGGPGVYPFLLLGAFVAAFALGEATDERKKAISTSRTDARSGVRGGDG